MSDMLHTRRLVLRRPTGGDWPAARDFFMSGRAAGIGGPLDLGRAWRSFAAEIGHWDILGHGMWAVTLRGDDRAVGLIGPWCPADWPETEIGWLIFDPGIEGTGIATEAARAAIDHAWDVLGWETIVSYIAPDNTVLHEAHYVPDWVKLAPFIAMLAGLLVAFQMYIRRPDWPRKLAENQRPLYEFLLNKWYFDEIYDTIFVRSAKGLGGLLWKRGDGGIIDGGINGLAMGIIPFFTRLAGRAQSGYVFHYAFAMVLGIAILITWFTLTGGAE